MKKWSSLKKRDLLLTPSYEVVRIEANSIEMIYSDKYDTLVGVDYHYGVKIGNIVYDNKTPQGMDFDAWKSDLGVGMTGIEIK